MPREWDRLAIGGPRSRLGVERLALRRDAAQERRRDLPRELRLRLAPERQRRFEPARASFGEPHGAAAEIALDRGDLDEISAFERAQVARQRRLIEPGAAGERAQRVVTRGGDLRHEPQLRRGEAGRRELAIEELADAPRRQAAVPAGAGFHQRAGVLAQRLSRLPRGARHSMVLQYLYLQGNAMSALPRDVLDLIGNTSLVALRHVAPKNGARILLKLESEN